MTTTDKTTTCSVRAAATPPATSPPRGRQHSPAWMDCWVNGRWRLSSEADYFASGSPPLTARGGRTTLIGWRETSSLFSASPSMIRPHRAALPSSRWRPTSKRSPSTTTTRVESPDYRMVVEDGIWKLWRDAPGFWQRYDGVFSSDGTTIAGAWEGSSDGKAWKHDFELNYTKVG